MKYVLCKQKGLKQIISIDNGTEVVADKILCEWGPQHCCITGWSVENNKATSLRYFSFPNLTLSAITSLVEEIRNKSNGSGVFFSSEFPEALMIPSRFAEDAQQLWRHFYAEEKHVFQDAVEQWQIINTYGIPQPLLNELNANFQAINFRHGFSTSLKVYNGFIANDSLSVHFTPYNFRVITKKYGKLLLTQMYAYQTPLDVVYYLLKICDEFHLPMDSLYLVVSGLIEESSALYTELTNYFQTVQFAATPAIIPETDYPSHYFTSIYNLSTCVS